VTAISESVAETVTAARLIERNLLPEARARYRLGVIWAEERKKAREGRGAARKVSPAERRRGAAALRALDAAIAVEQRAEQTFFNKVRNDWMRIGASTEARLATYFRHEELPEDWKSYRNVVLDHLRLSSSISGEERRNAERRIIQYLCAVEPVSVPHFCSAGASEPYPSEAAGGAILEQRVLLLNDIIDSGAAGYSVRSGGSPSRGHIPRVLVVVTP
jgi:hypothetical protein